jgi:hypothetical protein
MWGEKGEEVRGVQKKRKKEASTRKRKHFEF